MFTNLKWHRVHKSRADFCFWIYSILHTTFLKGRNLCISNKYFSNKNKFYFTRCSFVIRQSDYDSSRKKKVSLCR